jgi:hypothetical protein
MTGSFWAGWPQMTVHIILKFDEKPRNKTILTFGIKNALSYWLEKNNLKDNKQ